MKSLRFVLIVLFTVMLSAASFAESIVVKPVSTDSGLKVYFNNLNSDFELSKDKNIASIIFDQEYEIEDMRLLQKESKYVKSLTQVSKILAITLASDALKVEKFKEKEASGIMITDTSKQKAIDAKVEPQKVVQLDVVLRKDKRGFDTLKFNWNTQVQAAAFVRAGYLWVVFDKLFKVNASQFKALQNFSFVAQVGDNAMKFKITPSEVERVAQLRMLKDKTIWSLEYNTENKIKDLRVVSRPYAAPQPKVEIDCYVPETSVLSLHDDFLGDEIMAITISESNVATSADYKFVDFSINKSIQGSYVEKKSDAVLVQADNNIISIAGNTALNISPKQFKKSPKKFEEVQSDLQMDALVTGGISVLSIKSYLVSDDNMWGKILEFRNKLDEATSTDQRLKILTNWAIFYLANQMYQEGLMIVKMIHQEDPDYAEGYLVKLVESALLFMKKDYAKAGSLVKTIDMNDVSILQRKEVRFWQMIINYMNADKEFYVNKIEPSQVYLDNAVTFLNEYPDEFLIRFGLIIGERKVAEKQLPTVQKIIDKMPRIALEDHKLNEQFALKAKFFAAKNDLNSAVNNWDLCSYDYSDTLNMSMCRFEKNEFLYLKSEINHDEYQDELERIILVWKGDELEVKILKKLGESYLENDKFVEALRAWKKIVEKYPYSPDAVQLVPKMSQVFYDYFMKFNEKNPDPFKASALYFEFEKLVPLGTEGDDLVLKFLDNLVELDLLERAIEILKHQINFRLVGNKREIAINKLANIYIKNQRPDLAIEVIDSGDFYEELPDPIGKERLFIQANAYYQNEEYEKAVAMLKGNESLEADDLRTNVYWYTNKWDDFIKNAEPRIYDIRYQNDAVSERDAERALRLAVAYVLTNKGELLNKLISDFEMKLPDTKKANLIRNFFQSLKIMNNNKLEALKDLKLLDSKINDLLNNINGV